MSRLGDLWEARGLRQRRRPGRSQWIRTGVGLAFFVGCLLCLALLLPRYLPAHRRVGAPPTSAPLPQTPFQAAFAQAQRWHLDAQRIAKRQLESLEEWDPDGIRGSTPEIYRRSLIARTREIGRAAEAAREASRRAQTTQEMYQAARLLTHIEHDLGHRTAELEQAKKLMALQPLKPEARMLLERAVRENQGMNAVGPARPDPATPRF